jgi:hypothetical protein
MQNYVKTLANIGKVTTHTMEINLIYLMESRCFTYDGRKSKFKKFPHILFSVYGNLMVNGARQ